MKELFNRRWVCQVAKSNFHNGAHCSPDYPHDEPWDCGYRWEASLTDAQYTDFLGKSRNAEALERIARILSEYDVMK